MEIDCLQRNNTFKFKITLDRHNARLKLNYCLLPDPLHFSLPSTFNNDLSNEPGLPRREKVNNNYLLTSDSSVPLYNRFHRGEWITRVSGGEGALDTPGPLNGTCKCK
jgi:hypothetical protein